MMWYYIYCSDEELTHWEMKDTKETEALKGEEWEKVNYVFTDKYLDMSRNVKEQK